MATLSPYFNNIASGPYYTGYNASTNGAIYTKFGNWGFFPIFKNTTGEIIKLNSLTFGAAIYNGGAIGKIYFADLGTSLPSSVRVTPQSNSFSIPGGTTCQNLTVSLTSNVVINPNSYFLLGIKVCKTDNNSSYINIACDWFSSTQNAFYTSRDMSSGIDTAFDTVRVDTSRAPWDKRVPHMTVDYSNYKITPTVSSSNVTITQGQTASVTVSGYNDWFYGNIVNSGNVDVSKNGNKLYIKAKYFLSSSDISYNDEEKATRITIYGLNSSVTIKVGFTMPSITTCSFSSNIIRPLETVSITSKTSDGLTPIIESVSDNAGKLSKTNTTISCAAITEVGSGWAASSSGTNNPTIVLKHPYNTLRTATFSSASILQAKHYTENDINITLSSYNIYNIIGTKIYVTDGTQIAGGSEIDTTRLPVNFSYSNNVLTVKTTGTGNKDIYARLYNDVVVSKRYRIVITEFQNLEVVPNDNDANSKLPLFCYIEGNKIRLSPYSYPIRILYPTNYDFISRDGFSKRDIVIEHLEFGYINNGTFISLDNTYYDPNIGRNKIFWLSEMLNAPPSTKKDYLVSFGIPDFTISKNIVLPDTTLVDLSTVTVLDDNLCIKFIVSYTKTNESGETNLPVTINFSKYLNRIITFETNQYSNGTDIPGSVMKKPANKKSSDTVLADSDCGINNLFTPIKNIIKVYFGKTISGSQIVNAAQYTLVSNDTDKLFIESLLSQINSLNSAINKDSSLRILKDVRSKIAIGDPIMWDDSLGQLSDGRSYTQRLDSTASPWKELYNAIKNIQYLKKYRICYKDSNDIVYKVKYRIANTDYDTMVWR